jgi:riboflavin biosynthesis pyrimidine reductase
VRQLLPTQIDDVSIESAYQTPAGSPWLRLSMVLSVDGSATDENGWTTTLAGEPDARMLRALRAVSEAVIVGAGTVRTGRLGPIRTARFPDPAVTDGGPGGVARLVVVSGTLDLDWSLPLFTKSAAPPIVVTSAAGATNDLPPVLRQEMIVAGAGALDLASAVEQLHDRGLLLLLCEGGPGLAASLLDAALVDELCVTSAPAIMPADRLRGLAAGDSRIPLRLTHVGEDAGVLFLRYRPSWGR